MKLSLFTLFAFLSVFALSSCRDQINGPTPAASSDTVAHWTFDGNAMDVSGHGHNGTMSGNFDYNVPDRLGNYGKAVEVIGPGQMDVQSMPNFSDNDSYTISFWVSFSAGGTLLSTDYGFGADTGEFGADPQGCGIISSNQSLGVDRWRLITVAVSAHNTATLYIDSIAVVTKPYGSYTGTNDSMPLQIVFNQASATDTVRLDDAIILHYCLTSDQVSGRFHEGGWFEHNGGTVTTSQNGFAAGSFPTSNDIEGICFPSPALGYACGASGTILLSVDSGNSWAQMNSGTTENLYRISFAGHVGLVGGNNGTLLRSADDGKTWTQVTNVPFQTINGSLENIRDLKFLDATHAMIVGGAGNTQTAEHDGFVMLSNDAGLTWQRVRTASIAVYSIGFEASNHVVTVVGSVGEIYTSTDYGMSWNDLSVSDAGDDFLAVDFSPTGNTRAAMASTAYGTIYGTSDGGSQWGSPNQSAVTSALRTVKSVDVAEWWIAGDNGVILHTTNDGINWSRADINNVSVAWNEIVQRDAHTLAFIGDNGTLYWYKF